MKHVKLFCFFIATNLLIHPLLAAEDYIIPNTSFKIKTSLAQEKFKDMTLNVEEILLNFSPAGAEISNLNIINDTIQFKAKKRILFVSKTIQVRGIVSIDTNDSYCPRPSNGFVATMDFSGSDDIIYNSYENLKLIICEREINSDYLKADVSGLIIAGKNYSSVTGPIVRAVLAAQVKPVLEAIKAVVLKKP